MAVRTQQSLTREAHARGNLKCQQSPNFPNRKKRSEIIDIGEAEIFSTPPACHSETKYRSGSDEFLAPLHHPNNTDSKLTVRKAMKGNTLLRAIPNLKYAELLNSVHSYLLFVFAVGPPGDLRLQLSSICFLYACTCCGPPRDPRLSVSFVCFVGVEVGGN